VCGYHGWHDWYIGSTPRGIGVPSAVSSLAHTVTYGDLGGLERELRAHPTAAVIMEPMTGTWPADGYLASVRDLAHAHGALLVFDETITGFRFAKGGAQEYFGVTPDLASFGKGIANGFPLSAVVGPRDLMQDFEQVFFSGTFGGELLSLRAAQIVLDRVRTTDVVQQISASGALLVDAAQRAVEATDTGHLVGFGGHPSWQFINWNPDLGDRLADVKLLFMQEMCRNGVLVIATHNAMSVHDVADAAVVEAAYTASLSAIRDALDQGDVAGRLDATVVAQAATVRS
jgi:glutamate-1-semialdehyde aminotransferase